MQACTRLIQKHIDYLMTGFDCEPEGDYYVITTPYQFPDFDLIQVYVKEMEDGRLKVSDQGEAIRHVAVMCGHDIYKSQRAEVAEIASSYGLQLGSFGVLCAYSSYDTIGEALYRVSQGMRDIASLFYTARSQRVLTFRDEVRSALDVRRVKYEPNYVVRGKAAEHRVDLFIPTGGRKGGNLIQIIGGTNKKVDVNETFIIFQDLLDADSPMGRKVVVDKTLSQRNMELLCGKADDVIIWAKEMKDLDQRLRA